MTRMKKDETLEDLLKWKQQQETKQAIERATHGRIMLRCSTVLALLWTGAVGIGAWVTNHFQGIEAAVKAFIQSELGK
jgi:hypothetical protein